MAVMEPVGRQIEREGRDRWNEEHGSELGAEGRDEL